ncbi:MAG: transcriptional repressor [Vampirovibrionales bacterium]|nr:transcriptional repressor [Vampirovibrionales bacterium]
MTADAAALPLDFRERLLSELRAQGFRLTLQREQVLDVFLNQPTGDHLSVEELHRALKKQASDISLATTYRTLRLFVTMGVLRELDFSEDHKHYELIRDPEKPHHHIICIDCGKTAEFESPEVIALAAKIAREKRLTLVDVQLKIFANCQDSAHDDSFSEHESLRPARDSGSF